jgi:hypothetical protein
MASVVSVLDWPATGDEVDQYHDDRNDQQDVNKRTYGVASDHAEQPQDY